MVRPASTAAPPDERPAGLISGRLPGALSRFGTRLSGARGRWLSIFGVSLTLFLVRFLVPVPVGQSDNRDGPRLMCGHGLHLGPVVPHGDPRFFRFIYFAYAPSPSCAHLPTYPSSELVPLEVARLLTPVLGLPGTLNLIALGVLFCVLTSVGIASLAAGLRVRPWAQWLLAAALWLIMADAAFFDVDASPMSEPAALVGLLLVAAGVVYLGRGWRATVSGLVLAGAGGFLAILSKEQYLIWVVPICLTLILAATHRGGSFRDRFRTREAGAAVLVAALLVVATGGYELWDQTSPYAARLHHEQAVDMIFDDVVNGHDNARADLRALGLPASWARYAGHYYWDTTSVRDSPLYSRYEAKLNDGTIARFLLTHPGRMISIGQQAAVYAQQYRVTSLGDYPPSAGHSPGAYESRVAVVTWLMHRLPPGLGLLWLIPVWAAMAAVAFLALCRRRTDAQRRRRTDAQHRRRTDARFGRPAVAWHRDGAVLVLCMTGCAVTAFIPPAFFAGISTTRHMVGVNLATALAFPVAAALAVSLIAETVPGARRRREPRGVGVTAVPQLQEPGS
jgi:hypothetical protein